MERRNIPRKRIELRNTFMFFLLSPFTFRILEDKHLRVSVPYLCLKRKLICAGSPAERPAIIMYQERKEGFRKLMKNVQDAGFSRKRGGNAGSGPPPPFQTLNYVPLLFDRTHEREVKLELLTLSVCNVSLMASESSVWIQHYGCLISINLAFSKVPLDPIWSTCKRKRNPRPGCVSSCVILTLCAPIST